jgi:hypothetical protein
MDVVRMGWTNDREDFGKGLNDAGEGFLSVTSDTFGESGSIVGENQKDIITCARSCVFSFFIHISIQSSRRSLCSK